MSEQRADVHARITKEIIAVIEAGTREWRMPWHHDGASPARPTNVATGRRYRGINTLALWAAAVRAGYAQSQWGTYRQFEAVGAQVRSGEKATAVILWKEASTTGSDEDDANDTIRARRRMFARTFSVFNVAQVDGYQVEPAAPPLSDAARHARAETFLTNLGIKTVFGGSEACYQPLTDTVLMPVFSQFRDAASFYGVWIHESGHASGAKHRLDRDLTGRFGSAVYAQEEIIVELLSGMILADLAIPIILALTTLPTLLGGWRSSGMTRKLCLWRQARPSKQRTGCIRDSRKRPGLLVGSPVGLTVEEEVGRVFRDGFGGPERGSGRPVSETMAMAKTNQKITLSAAQNIPFDRLQLSQANVRQVKAGVSIEDLAADIAHRGLLASLTVRPVLDATGEETGMYKVPAGGRRFRALELLVTIAPTAGMSPSSASRLDALSSVDGAPIRLAAKSCRRLSAVAASFSPSTSGCRTVSPFVE